MGNCCSTSSSVPVESPRQMKMNHEIKVLPLPSQFEEKKSIAGSMIIIGDVTPTSAKIFYKAPSQGEWILMLSEKPFAFDHPQSKDDCKLWTLRITETKISGCFECNNLKEDTIYYYSVYQVGCLSNSVVRQRARCFSTAKSSYDSIQIGFYSCHDPFLEDDEVEPGAWKGMARIADELDMVIGGGDQVYVDNSEGMTDLWLFLREHQEHIEKKFVDSNKKFMEQEFKEYIVQIIRKYYLIYWNDEDLLHVFGRVPQYMVWDDHEIMDGWGSLTPEEKVEVFQYQSKLLDKVKNRGKQKEYVIQDSELILQIVEATWHATAQVYNEFQNCHNPSKKFNPLKDKPDWFEWDFSFCRGPQYQFYALDMRGNHDCTAESYLLCGEKQHERMEKWLNNLPDETEIAFIISPVPVIHWDSIVDWSVYVVSTLKDDLMDAWSHHTNHDERARLLDNLLRFSHEKKTTICMFGGDVHCMSAYVLTDEKRFPDAKIVHITASAITRKPCPSVATMAYAKNGFMKYKENGKGRNKTSSIYGEQRFAKSGVNNFAVLTAEGKTMSCTFFWKTKADSYSIESQTVDF